MPEASPFWQNAFLVGVLVVIGWCVWNGWRIGLVRSLFALFGMCAGLALGLVVGFLVAAVVGGVSLQFGLIFGWAAGVITGLIAYALVVFVGALIFKRTGQQRTVPLRLVYGAGGAAIGVFIGLSVLWGALLFVRALGGFWEPRFEPDANRSPLPTPNAAVAAIVKLKRSVEAGDTGRMLVSWDVMPEPFYRVMDKLGAVVVDPAAAERLLQYPEIVALMNDPKFLAISDDASPRDGGQSGKDMLVNTRMAEALGDPALIAKLQKIDIEKALDFALKEPAPPEPEHSP